MDDDDDPPSRRKIYACADGMCGAFDCETCRPENVRYDEVDELEDKMTDDELAAGIINIVAAELARGGWLKRNEADDIRGEAVSECLEIIRRKNLQAPLSYIRQSVRHIVITAARRVTGEPCADIQGCDIPVSDVRAEARAALDGIREKLRTHIDEGERIYREVTRIIDAI